MAKKTPKKKTAPACSGCSHLRAEITRNELTPVCLNKKYKFKERDIMDWVNDKDINSKSCDKFETFVPQSDKFEEK